MSSRRATIRLLQLIGGNPQMGRRRDDLPETHRSYLVGSHVIIYRIETDHVGIVRILHQRMEGRTLWGLALPSPACVKRHQSLRANASSAIQRASELGAGKPIQTDALLCCFGRERAMQFRRNPDPELTTVVLLRKRCRYRFTPGLEIGNSLGHHAADASERFFGRCGQPRQRGKLGAEPYMLAVFG